jgi:hypothetical protein
MKGVLRSQNFTRSFPFVSVFPLPSILWIGKLLWALNMNAWHTMVGVSDFAFAIFAAILK